VLSTVYVICYAASVETVPVKAEVVCEAC